MKIVKNRNTAIVLLVAGLYVLIGETIGYLTAAALSFVLLGLYNLRSERNKAGYVCLAAGTFILVINHFFVIIGIILVSLGYFYVRSRKTPQGACDLQKQSLLQSLKWDREPWVLKNTAIWFLAGEARLDLSLAMVEAGETTVDIQGVAGDVDIIIPDDLGIELDCTVLLGQINGFARKETGLMNRMVWRSPNYDTNDQKVKLRLSFVVADIDIKMI
jgi:lia operon protein LiaF